MSYKKAIFFLIVILLISLMVGINRVKKRESFINYKEYIPHFKKLHSQFKMDATNKVKETTETFHNFLRKSNIIY